jgi:hypothetical protein
VSTILVLELEATAVVVAMGVGVGVILDPWWPDEDSVPGDVENTEPVG